jgi:hypothetical protein
MSVDNITGKFSFSKDGIWYKVFWNGSLVGYATKLDAIKEANSRRAKNKIRSNSWWVGSLTKDPGVLITHFGDTTFDTRLSVASAFRALAVAKALRRELEESDRA